MASSSSSLDYYVCIEASIHCASSSSSSRAKTSYKRLPEPHKLIGPDLLSPARIDSTVRYSQNLGGMYPLTHIDVGVGDNSSGHNNETITMYIRRLFHIVPR